LAAVRRVLAGESVSAVAQELGIRRKRLYVWKDRYAELGEAGLMHRRGGRPRKAAVAAPGSGSAGRTRGVAGGAEADCGTGAQSGAAGVGTGFFRRSLAAHKSGREAICTLIAERAGQGGLSVERMCELSGVSRAGFYRHWLASAPRQADTAVRDAIQQIIVEKRFYGYRRVQRELRQRGQCVNAKRVLRLMREDNLLCLRTRHFVPATTDSQHGWRVWPNLARGLVTRNLNELWVADITYVRLQEEFVYVAVVLDAHSRRVIGWALAQHLGASVAVQALRMALLERQPAPGLIHHSDRGIQYACADYLTLLADHGVQPSMSRVGNPYDNAKAESFMKTLKQEQVRGQQTGAIWTHCAPI
jgi:putative transposase